MPNYRKLEKEGEWVPLVVGNHSYIYDSHQELLGILDSLQVIAGVFIETRRNNYRADKAFWFREYKVTIRKLGGTKVIHQQNFRTVRAAVSWALDTLINGEVKE